MTASADARPMTANATGTRRRRFAQWRVHLVVIVLMIVWLIPTIGLLVSSFRPPIDVTQTGWWTVFFGGGALTLDNYAHVLGTNNIGTAFVNSLIITIPATVIPVTIAAFAAYAFAWMQFPLRNVLFVAVVGLLVVPLQSTLIPVLQGFKAFGLNGQFVAVWLAHTGYGLPFAVYLLRNFMGELPREVFESAYIDGASPVTAFFRLALPMSVPAIAALSIFQFLFVWNDLLVALIYLGASNAEKLPLTTTIANLVNSLGGGWQYLASAAFLSMALPLLVFATLQRYFVRGIVGGSVKG